MSSPVFDSPPGHQRSLKLIEVKRPGGGIGRHAGLRSQCASVTVRVRPGAPKLERKHNVKNHSELHRFLLFRYCVLSSVSADGVKFFRV